MVTSILIITVYLHAYSGIQVTKFEVPSHQCERVGKASVEFLQKQSSRAVIDYTCIRKEQ